MLNTKIPLEKINALSKNTLLETLNIEVIEIGEDFLKAKMPVNAKVHQPAGFLHGGASVVLIESVGSMGSALCVDLSQYGIVGVEVNANHLKSKRDGEIFATGKLIFEGKRTHVWQVDVKDEADKLICTGRLTTMIIPLK